MAEESSDDNPFDIDRNPPTFSHIKKRGPHGVGDPNDRYLRKAEEARIIPQIIRNRTEKEKCGAPAGVYWDCVKKVGSVRMLWECRDETREMNECYKRWFEDDKWKDQVRNDYLNCRSFYRSTGIRIKKLKQINWLAPPEENVRTDILGPDPPVT